jgi:hypothetical protein
LGAGAGAGAGLGAGAGAADVGEGVADGITGGIVATEVGLGVAETVADAVGDGVAALTGASTGSDFETVRACGVSCQSTSEPTVVTATLPTPISAVSMAVSRFPLVRADICSPSLTSTPNRPAVSDMRNRTLPQDA